MPVLTFKVEFLRGYFTKSFELLGPIGGRLGASETCDDACEIIRKKHQNWTYICESVHNKGYQPISCGESEVYYLW